MSPNVDYSSFDAMFAEGDDSVVHFHFLRQISPVKYHPQKWNEKSGGVEIVR